MTQLAADKQRGLSPAVNARLVATGIGFRLMRSGVTVAVQALAVAFLVYVFAAATIDAAVQRGAATELKPYRDANATLSRLRQPDTTNTIIDALQRGDDARLAEFAAWTNMTDADLADARTLAKQWTSTQQWYNALPEDDRTLLLGDRSLAEVAPQLADTDAQTSLQQRMAKLQIKPPNADSDWASFLGDPFAQLTQHAQQIRAGHAKALRELDPASLYNTPTQQAADRLNEAGFQITQEELAELRPFAQRLHTEAAVTEALQDPNTRRALARHARVAINNVTLDTAHDALKTQADAQWLHDQLAQRTSDAATPPTDLLLDFAHHARTQRRLADVLPVPDESPGIQATWLGLPPRTLLLIALSCLVCVVGVANAMTMSVTERFSEIATMKCLGARSSSVMAMFLLESAVLGAAGGVIGTLLGMVLAVAGGLLRYGQLIQLASSALITLAVVAVLALVLGILLSIVAALLPSWFAARLPPIAAMRVE